MLRVQPTIRRQHRNDAAHEIPRVLIDRFDQTSALKHRAFEAYANPLLNPFGAATLQELTTLTKHLAFAIEIFAECSETDLQPFSRSLNAMDDALLEVAGCDSCIAHIHTEIVESIKAGQANATRIWPRFWPQ